MVWGFGVSVEPGPTSPLGVSVVSGNRRFLLVAVPIFVVAVGLVVAYLLLRPTIRRNAAILVESKLEVVIGVVEEVRPSAAQTATAERMDEAAPEDMEFRAADDPSDEPLVVSVLATDEVWTAPRERTRGLLLRPILDSRVVERGTIPGATARDGREHGARARVARALRSPGSAPQPVRAPVGSVLPSVTYPPRRKGGRP